MELYLIRHAQSLNNARPPQQRTEDAPLTDLGHRQASYLAAWIPSLNLTRLIVSPFLRTLQTAEHLRTSTSLAPEVWIDLHEQGGCVHGTTREVMVGRPGMSRSEIKTRFPAFHIPDQEDLDGEGWWKCKPYESQDAAEQRAEVLLERTRSAFSRTDQRVAYVMHGDFQLLFLSRFHSGPLGRPYNASVTKMMVSPKETRLEDYNRVAHLPEELKTF